MPTSLRSLRSAHLRFGLLIQFLFVAGCSYSSRVQSAADAEHATYEEHDHSLPPHMPRSFPHAVEELLRRHQVLADASPVEDPVPFRVEFQELCDIVGWLPMLAADSDLTEAEWLPIKQAADRLSSIYAEVRTNAEATPSLPHEPMHRAQQEFAALNAVAEERSLAFESSLPPADDMAQARSADDVSPTLPELSTQHREVR